MIRGRVFFQGKVKNQQPGETALEAAERVLREVKAYKAGRPDAVKKKNASRRRHKLTYGKNYVFKKYTALMPVGTEVCSFTTKVPKGNALEHAYPDGGEGRVVAVSYEDAHAPQLLVFFYKTGHVGMRRADQFMVTGLGENPSCKLTPAFYRLKRNRYGMIL